MYNPVDKYFVRSSPHIRRKRTSRMCMLHVIIALIPTVVCAAYFFGLPAICVMAASIAVCVATEWIIVTRLRPGSPMSLWAAALTGLLLALNLPSSTPLWIVAVGAIFAIGIGKMAFGGIGCNIFNPALVGRVFLLISFPVVMTTWPLPSTGFIPDGSTGATLLSALKKGSISGDAFAYSDLLIGNMGGSLGEVASVALLLGFAYLLVTKVITWHIPVTIIATVVVFDLCLGIPAGIDVFSGGLLLGSIFMATDYVTSPMTHKGMILYGIGIGIITVVIRRWGAYPEGMSFAILIMNGCTPLINRYMTPRRYGYKSQRKEAAA